MAYPVLRSTDSHRFAGWVHPPPPPLPWATVGLATAAANPRAGKLDDEEFADLVFVNAIEAYVDGRDAELQAGYVRILVEHDYYRDLQKRAFDITANVELQLLGSIERARSIGVAEEQILHTVAGADAYFLGVAPSEVGSSPSACQSVPLTLTAHPAASRHWASYWRFAMRLSSLTTWRPWMTKTVRGSTSGHASITDRAVSKAQLAALTTTAARYPTPCRW
ncbi:MAG: hypothetical protein L0H03_00660 [Rhodococcus sp. (in: high G+C Gram-positive bacteria)]|nr:hypothetical protein [Rhodococcus sp. (in: high G+C Gram-positive bacteria)]